MPLSVIADCIGLKCQSKATDAIVLQNLSLSRRLYLLRFALFTVKEFSLNFTQNLKCLKVRNKDKKIPQNLVIL